MDRTARRLEPRVRRRFLEAASAGTVLGLETAVAAGDLDRIVALLEGALTPEMLAPVAQALLAAYIGVAQVTGGQVGLSFDMKDPRAVAWAAEQAAGLLTGPPDQILEWRREVRRIIAAGQSEGIAPRLLAREISQVVGLDPRRAARLGRYMNSLSDSLPEDVRLRRISRFRDRLLRDRATVIARTETINASVAGKLAVWQREIELGLVDPSVTAKVWQTGQDERVCPICAPMHGTVVEIVGGDFTPSRAATGFDVRPAGPGRTQTINVTGYRPLRPSEQRMISARGPVEGPTVHPQCRCDVVLRTFESAADLQAAMM